MTVHSLAVWHSYVGNHARWVLGVRHDKERGASKRKYCNKEGCGNQVQQGGVCFQHGARVKRFSQDGCPRKRKYKRCSQEGCGRHVQQGGVCVEHGASVKLCNQDGCRNQVRQGGVCIKHGARKSHMSESMIFFFLTLVFRCSNFRCSNKCFI